MEGFIIMAIIIVYIFGLLNGYILGSNNKFKNRPTKEVK